MGESCVVLCHRAKLLRYVLIPSSLTGSIQLSSSLISAIKAIPGSQALLEAISSALILATNAVPCSLVSIMKAFPSFLCPGCRSQQLGARIPSPTTGLQVYVSTLAPRSLTSIQLTVFVSVLPAPILVLRSPGSTTGLQAYDSTISQAPPGQLISPAPSWPITTLASSWIEPILNPFSSTGLLIREGKSHLSRDMNPESGNL
ncbi:hypothetical protein ROHU_002396 [Labeo rohita]|uniref:Uncharacterized protein n=1 Tax=Labeo rohita TaxID=84645 RepID=A0A498NZC3_LABRO|nr:hypothetical protein ROHU_002396 [Labeo rohita]